MQVTFSKSDDGRVCAWHALRPPRTRVPGTAMAAGGDLPHDLSTFVIESTLGLAHGFWGCVAEGATFRTLGRRRTPQGRAVIQRHLSELDAAERRVNEVYSAWRRGEPTPVDEELAHMLQRWRDLPAGADLVLDWERTPSRRRRASR